MIDLQTYRSRIGGYMARGHGMVQHYKHNAMSNDNDITFQTTATGNVLTFSFYPFGILLYTILVFYFVKISSSILVGYHSLAKPYISHNSLIELTKVPDLQTVYVRLYFAIITCFIILRNFHKHAKHKPFTPLNLIKHIPALCKKISTRHSALMHNSMLWLAISNLVLVIITNPSLLNPGPAGHTSLSVLYQNVQGLVPISSLGDKNPMLNTTKLLEFQSSVQNLNPDLIALNETWLKPSINDAEIFPSDNYKVFRQDRSKFTHPPDPSNSRKFRANGGGVLIAIKADLDAVSKQINIKCPAEILSIELTFPNGRKVVVCTFYRVGNLGITNYNKVEEYLNKIAKRRGVSSIYIIGDLNLSRTSWRDHQSTCENEQAFINLFNDLSLSQIVDTPTHMLGNILDVVLTNNENSITDLKVLDQDSVCKADHFPITFNIKAKISRKKPCRRCIYNFSKANWTKLNEDFSQVNWDQILGFANNTQDLDMAWSKFKSIFFEQVDKHIPKIKIKSEFQPPWFDSEAYELCREKERHRTMYKATKNYEDYLKFSKCRRDIKHLVNNKKRDNFGDENDPNYINKKFWSYVKTANNSHRIPEDVYHNDVHKRDSTSQAELFNQFFYAQFSQESKYDIPMSGNLQDNHMFHIDFTHFHTITLLRNINPNKAQGPDGIHGRILKNCAATLAYPLTKLFKLPYYSGHIPADWKLANVVPVHKKGSKNNVENYRPISLTSIVMKQFEKIIKNELMTKCEHYINSSQHSFLPKLSCTTQMVTFTDSLSVSLNNNYRTDVIYFDFAKAFDSVNHDILLHKLKYKYQIDGLLLKFIVNYLKRRKQQVVVGNATSSTLTVNSGVPQGSIIGPLLFVLFINDIGEGLSESTNLALYADDTKIWRNILSQQDHEILQHDINLLYDWSTRNKMNFHPNKCHVLAVTRKRLPSIESRYAYMLNDIKLEYCLSEKDLGVLVTTKLNWTDHCNQLLSKANQKLGLIKRTCHFVENPHKKRILYLTLVRSQFEHCSVVWRPYNKTTINKLENLQKKAVKWILNEEHQSYSDSAYIIKCCLLNLMPINFRFLLNDLILLHCIINDLSPIKLPFYLSMFDGNHRLRSCHLDHMSLVSSIKPRVYKQYSKSPDSVTEFQAFENAFFYRSHMSWNRLPIELRENNCPTKFKAQLSKYIWKEVLESLKEPYVQNPD